LDKNGERTKKAQGATNLQQLKPFAVGLIMNLAAILGICLLSLGNANAAVALTPEVTQQAETAPQNTETGKPQTSNPSNAPKSKPHKKITSANCSDAPATSQPSAAAKPCPPKKKVVRNGGANEPEIKITPDTAPQQDAQKRSTEQLTAATEQNLKKVEGQELSSNQKDLINQIHQYLQQSKAAAATEDLDQAHSLAQKAHLLSQELVKP
jgi:hypothetical protein